MAFLIGAIIGFMIGFSAYFSISTYRSKQKILCAMYTFVTALYVALGMMIGMCVFPTLAPMLLVGAVIGLGVNELLFQLAEWFTAKHKSHRGESG